MNQRIETERLLLRPFARADAEALHRLFVSPGVRRYLLDDQIVDPEWVDDEIAKSERLMASDEFGLWSMLLKETGELIGFCGFRFFNEPPELQLLYGLAEQHWNRGLATEAARTMIRRGFEVNKFERIIAAADAPNTSSHRVMQKVGMSFEKRVTVNGLDTVYYAIARP